jgi:aryl-alcohol dehydrogenase-like predicted oxidoreductase
MIQGIDLAASFTFPGTSMTVNRMGYGAMQFAGPQVFGPPRDTDEAIAVLQEALESGVNHIDTSDYYGPHVTNQIIRQALHPYPKGLVIVTKLGARRGADVNKIHPRGQRRHSTAAVVHPRTPAPIRQNSSFTCTAIMRGLLSPPSPTPSKPVGGDVV